jgi:hypothetical protein
MMSYTGISQDLVPKVLLIKNKKHFCFTIAQSRELAKLLELGNYNDSLVTQLSITNWRLHYLTYQKDSVIDLQKTQLKNYVSIVSNNKESRDIMTHTIKRKDKRIKRSRLHKIILTGSILVVTTVLISK